MRGNGAGDKGATQVVNDAQQQRPGNNPPQGAGPTSPETRPEGLPPNSGQQSPSAPSPAQNGPAGQMAPAGQNGSAAAASNGGPTAATAPDQGVNLGSMQLGEQQPKDKKNAEKNSGSQAAHSGDRSRVRRARLRTVRVDPWSVMKTAFLLAIAFGIVTVVAVGVIWQVLDTAGVYDSINRTVGDVLNAGDGGGERFDVMDYIALKKVLGFATLIAVVDVVLITALATLAAFLYNLSASLLGGVELTLAEDD